MKKEIIERMPTLKQYLEDLYKSEGNKVPIPIGKNLLDTIRSNVYEGIEKENRFKNEKWYHENKLKVRELLDISIIQTIKVINFISVTREDKKYE